MPLYNHYQDVQRDERCVAVSWSSGHILCTPLGEDVANVVFTDAACSQPAARYTVSTSSCTKQSVPRHAAVFTNENTIDAVYELGPPIDVSAYYVHVGSECRATAVTSSDQLAKVEAIDPSSLAELFWFVPTTATRLRHAYYVSSDGLRAWAGAGSEDPIAPWLVDSWFASYCTLADSVGGSVSACLPGGTAIARYYADSQCSQHLAAVTGDFVPSFIYTTGEGCSIMPRLFLSGASYSGNVFTSRGTACVAIPRPAATSFFRPGSEVSLASLTLDTSQGGPRIHLAEYVSNDGVRTTSHVLYDVQLADLCRPLGTYGETRCVPLDWSDQITINGRYYGASDCSQPLSVHQRSEQDCAPRTGYTHEVYSEGSGGCRREEFNRILGVHQGPLYRCGGYPAETGYVYYDLGPALGAEAFVPVTGTVSE